MLHAQFTTPTATVRRLMERATGGQPTGLEQVVNGYDNEVYRVDLAGHRRVFVRLRRGGNDSFSQELWAMDLAREAGVPVPRVVFDGFVEDKGGTRPAMVMEGAPGQVLADLLPRLSPSDRYSTLADLGSVLRQLHSVNTPGVWRPDQSGTWPNAEELRRGFVADRIAEREHLVTAGLTADEVDRTIALLGAAPDTPPVAGFVLCHGDVTPDHIFIDPELRVSALIDWGMWHGGSAVGELAYVSSWAFAEPDLSAILKGYGGSLFDGSPRRALALSLVNNLVGHVAHHVTIGDTEGAANVTASLRRALVDASKCE